MPTSNVSLSKQQADFIRQAIKGGRFQNASEVVRAGLHLLAQEERKDQIKLESLQRLAKQGFDEIDQGDYESLTRDSLAEFLESVRATPKKKGRVK